MIYPIGSIYMSVNAADPSALFGGEWERIEDTFLLAAGQTYAGGRTGGASAHRHISPAGYNASNNTFGVSYAQGSTTTNVNAAFVTTNQKVTEDSGSYKWTLPSTSEESNMPPYLAVYMWQRTA